MKDFLPYTNIVKQCRFKSFCATVHYKLWRFNEVGRWIIADVLCKNGSHKIKNLGDAWMIFRRILGVLHCILGHGVIFRSKKRTSLGFFDAGYNLAPMRNCRIFPWDETALLLNLQSYYKTYGYADPYEHTIRLNVLNSLMRTLSLYAYCWFIQFYTKYADLQKYF